MTELYIYIYTHTHILYNIYFLRGTVTQLGVVVFISWFLLDYTKLYYTESGRYFIILFDLAVVYLISSKLIC